MQWVLPKQENPFTDWRAQICCHVEATPRTCLRSCPLLFTSSACWSPPWCWPCSPSVHPPARVSPRMAPLLPAVRGAGPCSSLSLACRLQGVWSQKLLGFRPWSPMSWVSAGRCSLSLAFEASECIYSHLPERHCSKFSGLLCLLSSKFSSAGWKDPLLLLYWRSIYFLCFFYTEEAEKINASK